MNMPMWTTLDFVHRFISITSAVATPATVIGRRSKTQLDQKAE